MNKDVIYIEPEQDITDILANIKSSKHRIVALVPPKKAGVLRSAVNFKLIAKTARQNDKTVVLVTTDESLRRLASSVSMPTAKTLQSKPQLPDSEEADEFGNDEKGDGIIEDEAAEEDAEDEAEAEAEEKPSKKVPVATAVKVSKKKSATPEEDVIEGEPEDEADDKKPKTKNQKNAAKMKGAKIPNIAKYRKFIIAGAIALVVLIVFGLWATLIAPAAKITVSVRAAEAYFNEKVTFVTDESKADAKAGTLFLEQKSVTKKAEADFEATGKLDKGAKATGSITVTRPKGDTVNCNDETSTLSIPKGTVVTIGDKSYVVSEGGSANAADKDIDASGRGDKQVCTLKNDISSGAIAVVAKENGEGYNIAASNDAKLSITTSKKYTVSSTAMQGGSSQIVKIVSSEDIEKAASGLGSSSESEAREELASQFSNDYILLGNMTQSDPKITTSPNVNEEVGDNVTPKIVKEVTYTMYAVQRESVKAFITETVNKNLGENSDQEIYDTGIDKAFFESFQNSSDNNSVKVKTSVKTGPRVTKEMVADKSLGKKTGEVKNVLGSINGVSNVKIETSYFWVWSIPSDINKVDIEIKVE